MMYFKGTDRAIYAILYTQLLGQYNIFIYSTVVTTELHSWLFPIIDSTYTEALGIQTS